MGTENIVREILSIPDRAAKQSEMEDLAGEPAMAYPEAHAQLRQLANAVATAQEMLSRLEAHTHRWDDRGFCSFCGADGNA